MNTRKLKPRYFSKKRLITMATGMFLGSLFLGLALFSVKANSTHPNEIVINDLLINLAGDALAVTIIGSLLDYWNDLNSFQTIEGGLNMAMHHFSYLALSLSLQLAVMWGARMTDEQKIKLVSAPDPDAAFQFFQSANWDFLEKVDFGDKNFNFKKSNIENYYRVLGERKKIVEDLIIKYSFAIPNEIKTPIIALSQSIDDSYEILKHAKENMKTVEYEEWYSVRIRPITNTMYQSLQEIRKHSQVYYAT